MCVGGFTSCETGKTAKPSNLEKQVSNFRDESEPGEETEVISVDPPTVEEEVKSEQEDTSSDDIEEDPSNWLSAIGKIKGLNVKGYRLRGEGPDGARFDWVDVKSSKVALSDIRRGEWTLYAQAIGEDGTVVATGSLKTFLSESTPLGTLFLSDEVGSGSVKCNLKWNTSQVLYPSVEVYVKTHDGEFKARDKSEIKMTGDGEAVWTAKNVPAGAYIVRVILKDENEVVSGVAAALRVVENKESVGNCNFVIGKLSTVFGIDLQGSPVDTVEGEIVLTNGILSFESMIESLSYTWFIDGSAIPEINNQKVDITSLGLKKGYYRFDCIASQKDGFNSINTNTVYVYVDGDNIMCVSPEEADSNKGDIPTGYFEVLTEEENEEDGSVIVSPLENLSEDNSTAEENSASEEAVNMDYEEILRYIPEDVAEQVEEAVEDARSKGQTSDEIWEQAIRKAYVSIGRDPEELAKFF